MPSNWIAPPQGFGGGGGAVTAPLQLAAQTVSAPTYSFSDQTNSGMFLLDPDPTFANQGVSEFQIGSGQIVLPAGALFGWAAGTITAASTALDLSVTRDAADVLAQRRGTNAQILRIYGTFTDASNYERLGIITQSGDATVISQQQAGTGTARILRIGTTGANSLEFISNNAQRWNINSAGNFLANTDNVSDIGVSGATRPRTAYIGTSAFVPIIYGGPDVGNNLTLYAANQENTGGKILFGHRTGQTDVAIIASFADRSGFIVGDGVSALPDNATFVLFNRATDFGWGVMARNTSDGASSSIYSMVTAGTTTTTTLLMKTTASSGLAHFQASGTGLTELRIEVATADPITFLTGGTESFRIDGTTQDLTFKEGIDFIFGTTTGTKFGTATTQKQAWWNATPVVQQAGIVDADGTLADVTSKLNSLLAKMETYGLLAAA